MGLLDFLIDDDDFEMENHPPVIARQMYDDVGVNPPAGPPSRQGATTRVIQEVTPTQSDHQGMDTCFSLYFVKCFYEHFEDVLQVMRIFSMDR